MAIAVKPLNPAYRLFWNKNNRRWPQGKKFETGRRNASGDILTEILPADYAIILYKERKNENDSYTYNRCLVYVNGRTCDSLWKEG